MQKRCRIINSPVSHPCVSIRVQNLSVNTHTEKKPHREAHQEIPKKKRVLDFAM